MGYTFNLLQLPNGGVLGLGCCPGHRLKRMAVVPRQGSLDDDLAKIAAWQPHLVLTLMEEGELAHMGVPLQTLSGAFARFGIRWSHLPIPNWEPPSKNFEAAWSNIWPDLDLALRGGARLFLHCYAGLGRTGTVASLILMNYGLSARDAILAVRAARPGAVETLVQEHYLKMAGRNDGKAEPMSIGSTCKI